MDIVVYCSSREGLDSDIENAARAVGTWIGERGHRLVYGGVKAGLMHIVAESTHKAGGKILGVVPEVFRHRADQLCDEIILTADLSERKAEMIRKGDIFIVLPGGIGTIDEWVSTLSDIMVMERVNPDYDKPLIVADFNNIYKGMRLQLDDTASSVFARGKRLNRSLYANNTDELISLMSSHEKK